VPLRLPISIALDSAGNLLIADLNDNRVRRVSTTGVISTVAGNGLPVYSGDRGKATAAGLNSPAGVATDAKGNLYIADEGSFRVRRVTPDGIINTVAGSGTPGSTGDGGSALNAQLIPIAVLPDGQGNLYISDVGLAGLGSTAPITRIRKVDSNGKITTVAGNGHGSFAGAGNALTVSLGLVVQMVLDSKGNLYLADLNNYRVLKIDTSGNLTVAAGAGTFGTIVDGFPANNALVVPQGIAVDSNGTLYIADINFDLIFRVDSQGLIFKFAGSGSPGFSGDHGPALAAQFNSPAALVVDGSNDLYVADAGNARVRKISASIVTTVAGTDIHESGPATSAFLNLTGGLAIDGSGNIVVADTGNHEARLFKAGGNITPIGQFNGGNPQAVAVDQSGNFYITDDEPRVLKVSPIASTSSIAGSGTDGYSGDNKQATLADISDPSGVAVDSGGNVYITDHNHNRIRKIAPSGIITTIAGNGKFVFGGDNGPATASSFDPIDVAVDNKGNLYIADQFNNRIRRIDTTGIITTVAGNGSQGFSGDGGPAIAAQLFAPSGIVVDNAGNLFIADFGNFVIRRVTQGGLISTIAGTGVGLPATGDGGPAISAQMNAWRVALDNAGDLYITDFINDRVRKLTPKVVAPGAIKITSGNNQSATIGKALGNPLTVQVVDAAGAGVPGVVVNFSTSPSGAATVSPSPSLTLADGTASVNVTLGNTAGNVTITAAATGVSSGVSFAVTALPDVVVILPVISDNGIVSAGLSVPPVLTLSPNAMVLILGNKFAPDGSAMQVGPGDLVNGKVPVNFAGVCVQIGTVRAPVLAVYSNQITVQVPTLPAQNTTAQVFTNCDASTQQSSNMAPVTIQDTAPEFFYFAQNPDGHNPIQAVNATTGAYIGSPGLIPGVDTLPAQPGDVLNLSGTGFGLTDPPFNAGDEPGTTAQVTASVTVTIGGVPLDPQLILYAGVTSSAGVYALTIQIPDSIPAGDQTVVVTVGGVSSPPNAHITIGQPQAPPADSNTRPIQRPVLLRRGARGR
jgi:uncharacterized protein (TIGR03437 family)